MQQKVNATIPRAALFGAYAFLWLLSIDFFVHSGLISTASLGGWLEPMEPWLVFASSKQLCVTVDQQVWFGFEPFEDLDALLVA